MTKVAALSKGLPEEAKILSQKMSNNTNLLLKVTKYHTTAANIRNLDTHSLGMTLLCSFNGLSRPVAPDTWG
jgi:hypothetical protein